ncbi:acetyl-CoA C-acyltransferase [Sedimentitalea sp. HM32M-2]|uniref:acetyl-CoA C-acyltransferase n=1 Tax=Sedimentitalea sp. HM32M-2 TaxID=3351566 RepID=UPI00362ABBC2
MTTSQIVAARRSAVAPRNGRLADLALHDLAAPVLRQVLADAGLPAERVGEVVLSNGLGGGGNPARVVALAAGLPWSVAGLSVDRQCAGGLDALLIADAMIRAGQHEVVVAGGAESYSRRPLRYRTFADGRDPQPYEQAPFTPWPDRDPDMAVAADRLAAAQGIDRAEQDAWAIASHQKARAVPDAVLADQICAVAGLTRDTFTRDLGPRHCARAKVVSGSVTAANMAVAADAAAFVVVVSDRVARSLPGPAVALVAGATTGDDPELPGIAPVRAIQALLAATGTAVGDLDVAEIMEAFAVQAIACQRGADLPGAIVNPQGGALARGHPIGASGAILAVSLFHRLRRGGGTGLAAIAAAGGLGTALLARAG